MNDRCVVACLMFLLTSCGVQTSKAVSGCSTDYPQGQVLACSNANPSPKNTPSPSVVAKNPAT
jgi:hypothetical protein